MGVGHISENLTKKKGNLNRTQEHNGGGEYSSLIKNIVHYRDTMPYWENER